MANTLSIRLEERDRKILEAEAKRSGSGLSTLIRGLAKTEAHRLRNAAIRVEGERVVAHLATNPGALKDSEAWSEIGIETWPVSDWPGNAWRL